MPVLPVLMPVLNILRSLAWCLQVLNVAEKNSIAVQVSSALSNNSARREASWFAWPRACTFAVL